MPAEQNGRLLSGEITVGKPIVWDIVNSSGKIIFKKGFVFNTEIALQRVDSMELYRGSTPDITLQNDICLTCDAPADEKGRCCKTLEDPCTKAKVITIQKTQNSHGGNNALDGDMFMLIAQNMLEWAKWAENVHTGKSATLEKMQDISNNLQTLYLYDPELCLASIQWLRKYPEINTQPINMAFLCLMGSTIAELVDKKHIHSLVCAALTANISLYLDQEVINQQPGKLPQDLQLLVYSHPARSVRMLKALGVKDALWLSIVEQHHLANPAQLNADDYATINMTQLIQLFNIADTYLSLISKRGYRNALCAHAALKQMYKIVKAEKSQLLQLFIKELGLYPPGSLVKIRNGTLCMVYRRNSGNMSCPWVKPVLDGNGKLLDGTAVLATDNEDNAIITSEEQDSVTGNWLEKLYATKNAV